MSVEHTTSGTTRSRRRPYACAWCGQSMVDSEHGRRRKYCKRSCRQRAYEQRALTEGTSIPSDAVILTQAEVSYFGDRLFALRCAAEDLATAVDENADTSTVAELAEEVVTLAKDAERLR